jgi:hypothetical protein
MDSLELLINAPDSVKVNEAFTERLAAKINEMILTDFPGLVRLLYRIDISEKKLKELTLGRPQEETAKAIASLIIERQLEKAMLRKQYRADNDITEDEKW